MLVADPVMQFFIADFPPLFAGFLFFAHFSFVKVPPRPQPPPLLKSSPVFVDVFPLTGPASSFFIVFFEDSPLLFR